MKKWWCLKCPSFFFPKTESLRNWSTESVTQKHNATETVNWNHIFVIFFVKIRFFVRPKCSHFMFIFISLIFLLWDFIFVFLILLFLWDYLFLSFSFTFCKEQEKWLQLLPKLSSKEKENWNCSSKTNRLFRIAK